MTTPDQSVPGEAVADIFSVAVEHNSRGVELRAQGEIEAAINQFRKAIELAPNFADAHTNLGSILLAVANIDDSVLSFERAVNIKPDYDPAQIGLQAAREAYANMKEASREYTTSLKLLPGKLRKALGYEQILAECTEHMRRFYPAEEKYSQKYYLKLLHHVQARKLVDLQEFDLAVRCIVGFLSRHPFDGWWAYKVLSWIFTQKGDRAAAQSCAVGKIVGAVPEWLLPLPDRKITSLDELRRSERGFSHRTVEMDPGREKVFFPDTLTLVGRVPEIWKGSHESDLGDPEVTMLPLGRACISAHGAAIFSRKGKFIPKISVGDGRLLAMAGELPKVTKLRGTVLFLADPWSDEFFHWMMETFPRIPVLAQAGIPLDSIDHYYVRSIRPYHLEMLRMLGVPEDRLIPAGDMPHIQADRLILVSNVIPPYPTSDARFWACETLRNAVLPHKRPVKESSRKIIISRKTGHGRQLRNEAELWKLLEGEGFSYILPEEFQIAEQAAIISEARTIIAPAGAALANLAFASPGADVLIFYPPSVPWRFYWHLATFMGYRHYYLHGEVNPESDEVETDWVIDDNDDFSVDLKLVRKFLRICAQDSFPD